MSKNGKKRNLWPLFVIIVIGGALGIGTLINLLFSNIGWWQAVGVTAFALTLFVIDRGRQ